MVFPVNKFAFLEKTLPDVTPQLLEMTSGWTDELSTSISLHRMSEYLKCQSFTKRQAFERLFLKKKDVASNKIQLKRLWTCKKYLDGKMIEALPTFSKTDQVLAVTLYLIGDAENKLAPCEACAGLNSKGPASKCFLMNAPLGPRIHSCTNCRYSGNGPKCSYVDDHEKQTECEKVHAEKVQAHVTAMDNEFTADRLAMLPSSMLESMREATQFELDRRAQEESDPTLEQSAGSKRRATVLVDETETLREEAEKLKRAKHEVHHLQLQLRPKRKTPDGC